jgi:hypothetical protein
MDGLTCGCCEEILVESPVGYCLNCSEDGKSEVPLCSKCVTKHRDQDRFKKTRGHAFRSIPREVLQPLEALGISQFGQEFCNEHPGEGDGDLDRLSLCFNARVNARRGDTAAILQAARMQRRCLFALRW